MKLCSPLLPYLAWVALFFTACDSKKRAAGDLSGVSSHSESSKITSPAPEDEITQLRRNAEQGDAKAQCELGVRYNYGQGVEKDEVESKKWYRKAAEQGDVRAQLNLGLRYANGLGLEKDVTESVKWYQKAAEQGNADAQFYLGSSYANGQGVVKNEAEAVKWYRKAAEQGDVSAQLNLGLRYANGQGVEKDEVEAVRWYRKAADQGNAMAQFFASSAKTVGRNWCLIASKLRKPLESCPQQADSRMGL